MKADWNGYSAELDKLIEDIEPIPANYKCFVESVRVASRRHISRGCRTEYVSGLTDESKSLYKAYKCKYSSSPFDHGTIESGNTLIDKMTSALLQLTTDVAVGFNQRKPPDRTVCVAVDLSAAFDAVCHNNLLSTDLSSLRPQRDGTPVI